MRCPYCNHDETQVVETRESDEGGVIRRRANSTEPDGVLEESAMWTVYMALPQESLENSLQQPDFAQVYNSVDV